MVATIEKIINFLIASQICLKLYQNYTVNLWNVLTVKIIRIVKFTYWYYVFLNCVRKKIQFSFCIITCELFFNSLEFVGSVKNVKTHSMGSLFLTFVLLTLHIHSNLSSLTVRMNEHLDKISIFYIRT